MDHRRALWLGVSAVVGWGCAHLPTASEAGVSFEAVPAVWPVEARCLNAGTPGVAKEVLVGSLRTVVIAAGPRPISDEAWKDYSPGLGNVKNTDRHLLFSRSCFVRSPGVRADCAGDDCRSLIELDGHTWLALSRVAAADCAPAGGRCDPNSVAAGQLAFIVTEKCHELVFEKEVFRLRGPGGVEAIMHATADGAPSTEVALPAGYSVSREALTAPLVVRPYGGGGGCYYNIVRDARGQSYHQVGFAGGRYP